MTEAFLDAMPGEGQLHVIDGARHIQAYDKSEFIDQAIVAIDSFYRKHLE